LPASPLPLSPPLLLLPASPSPLPLLPASPLPLSPPVSPLPAFPVVPVPPELPLVPLPPVEVDPPPPTGAAPPDADDTGMDVVVVDGGVVVVVLVGVAVVVVVVDVAVPVVGGVVGPDPATTRTADGAALARCGDGVLATTVLPWAEEVDPADTGPVPPGWLTVPTGALLVGPAGGAAFGTVGVVLLGCEETGPLAESTLWAIGPAPTLRPAATESPAAATAPDATRRLRTKKSFDAVIGSGVIARRGALGSGCPKERDVKTSSKVA
jgi:hypothetical protein